MEVRIVIKEIEDVLRRHGLELAEPSTLELSFEQVAFRANVVRSDEEWMEYWRQLFLDDTKRIC